MTKKQTVKITLQSEGTEVYYKDIRIKELIEGLPYDDSYHSLLRSLPKPFCKLIPKIFGFNQGMLLTNMPYIYDKEKQWALVVFSCV